MLRRLTAQFKKQICPYCFEDFEIKNTPFRCNNDPKICAPETDLVYSNQWHLTMPLGKVIPPKGTFTGGFSKQLACPSCNKTSPKRLCPHCHSNLPHTMGEQDNLIFAVIGAKNTGKSHYIAVLIEQIKKVVGPAHHILLEATNDETINRYRQDFYNPIYVNQGTLNATRSGRDDNSVRQPLVYSLAMTRENRNGNRQITKAVTLVFYDTAGEDLNNKDNMDILNKYIYRSNGIIVLIDPLQLPYVRNNLPKGTPLPTGNSDTADILTRTTRLIEDGQGLRGTDQISTPLAIAFSKFDAVLPLVDEQFQLHADPNHDDGFDNSDFEAVNSEMMSLLEKWNCKDIVNQVRTRYKKVGFFGISALGCNPHDSHKIACVIPKRVEDPLLWLLASNGIIPRSKANAS